MTRSVARLFDSYKDALAAVHDLEQASFDPNMISLVARNDEERPVELKSFQARAHDHELDMADDAVMGAGAGAVVGGGVGALAGLGLLAIPGIGPAVAAGWLVSTVIGAAAGAVTGATAGGLVGVLTHHGHTEEEAHILAEGVRRGAALVALRVGNDTAAEARQILERHGGVDASAHARTLREAGWGGRFEERP